MLFLFSGGGVEGGPPLLEQAMLWTPAEPPTMQLNSHTIYHGVTSHPIHGLRVRVGNKCRMLSAQRCTRNQILEELGGEFKFFDRKLKEENFFINHGHPRSQNGDRTWHVEEQIYLLGCSHVQFLPPLN